MEMVETQQRLDSNTGQLEEIFTKRMGLTHKQTTYSGYKGGTSIK